MENLSLIQKIVVWALPVLFAITVHEVAHGWVANLFGDKTAKLSGRLTLNPIKHIDLVGTIIVPIMMLLVSNFIFGWAKPVPVDARNLRNPRYNMIAVAAAGPISNLLMAFLWAGVAKLGMSIESSYFSVPMVLMGWAGIQINIVLCVLNLLPIPPLDGSRVVGNLLPPRMAYSYSKIEPYGFFILILLMLTNVLNAILTPPIYFLFNFISNLIGLN